MDQKSTLLSFMKNTVNEAREIDRSFASGHDKNGVHVDKLIQTIDQQLRSPDIAHRVNQQNISSPPISPEDAESIRRNAEAQRPPMPPPPPVNQSYVQHVDSTFAPIQSPYYTGDHIQQPVYQTATKYVGSNVDYQWFAIEILKRLDIIIEKLDGQKATPKKRKPRRVPRRDPKSE